MAEKVTTMNLKVNLQCEKCYRKVKKVLGKFPQITEQLYDEKKNTVRVTVVCCSPEKMRDKLCCKGGGSIRSIEIVEPPKPAPPKEPEKKKEADKPTGKTTKPKPPNDEPRSTVGAADPPPVQAAWVFPEPMPVSVLAYPAPAQPVGLFYYGGPGGPTGFYGRPIYDSYGGGGPSYVRSRDQNPWEEEEFGCTIT